MSICSAALAALLSNAGILVETSSNAKTLATFATVLKKHLVAYYDQQNDSIAIKKLEILTSREELELLTAKEAISLVCRIQTIVDVGSERSSTLLDDSHLEPSILGTRDLAKLRTLLLFGFRWGIDRLYARVSSCCESNDGTASSVDMASGNEEDFCLLADLAASFLSLVFPDGPQGRISQTLITSTIIIRHTQDLLLPLIALGWSPDAISKKLTHDMPDFQFAVTRLTELVAPSQIISALGNIITPTSQTLPRHVRTACNSLLTKQLLRQDGVQGLLTAILPEEQTTGSEVPLNRLEQVARILNSVPSTMTPMEYYQFIFPRVLQVLVDSSQLRHKRAAAFTVHRALIPKKVTRTSIQASSTVLSLLQGTFLEPPSSNQPSIQTPSRPRRALQTLMTLLLNAEPSPTFVTKLLSPLIAPLYRMSYDLSRFKTADPQLRESVLSLLKSWGKIVEENEGASVLWALSENDDDCEWKFDAEGNIWKAPSCEIEKQALLMPQNPTIIEDDVEKHDLNIFDFYPDPIHFVETLKCFDRGDIASALFVKFLEDYGEMKAQRHQDPMKVLHKLQIITQFQKYLTEDTTSGVLSKPSKLLSFIHHVLASATGAGDVDVAATEDADSDDEQDDLKAVVVPDDELVETAITLLLSVLEANEMISAVTHPILDEIFSFLPPLSLKGTPALRAIACEARLVMTARLSDTSGVLRQKKDRTGSDVQEVYQRALKLLQDPVLPVRAHGLLLLRELLGASYAKDQLQTIEALTPSILSIFLQSVQDDDSYIFLNATQGLAALVDRFGKNILQGLMREYTEQLDGQRIGNLTTHDIDILTRIGEALGFVIKRCGTALGLYVDLLVPPLFAVIRNIHVPTVLRMSSISLLADCIDTYSLAVLPYAEDLCTGFIDLLQVESIPANAVAKDEGKRTGDGNDDRLAILDSNPTSKDSKIPPLRRAALHFLSTLIRASTRLICERSTRIIPFPRSVFYRANTILEYMSSVDEDRLVRVMAMEAKENLEQLQSAMLGLSELI